MICERSNEEYRYKGTPLGSAFNDPWPPNSSLASGLCRFLTGKVVKITDGDTLYLLDANYEQHKIRLAGIDAPERKQAF